jgi:ABC-type molybdenum transport system ATPase subunit/photorepair protein PhrA
LDGQLEIATPHISTSENRRRGVGWVSTELHMETAKSAKTAYQIMKGVHESSADGTVRSVATWLGVVDLLNRPLHILSQGEQKLVLIGAALASCPAVLILDEITQNLDSLNRNHVLQLIERVCQATNVSLIYITHHNEELLPSVTQVLHLSKGQAVYYGSRDQYNEDEVKAEAAMLETEVD